MMAFDQPGWLWGLLALAVPLAIHLLNATSGRPIPFPGQRFAEESPARRVRSIHLRQPWLLALRLSIFALLALALAGPRWVEPAAVDGGAGRWITPMALMAASADLKEQIQREGAAAVLVSPGLLPAAASTAGTTDEPAGALLKQLLEAEVANLPAKLTFTDHPLDRPWRVLLPEGVDIDEVRWRSQPLKVGLAVGAGRQEDGRYLRAALAALSSLGVLTWRELPAREPVDILITLGTAPASLPEHRLRLADVPAATQRFEPAFLRLGDERFSARLAAPAGGARPLLEAWQNRSGASVGSALSLEPGAIPTIRFQSRFHPDWTPLVASGVFPDVLLNWLRWYDALPQPLPPPAPATLVRWLAWLIAALWLLERFVSRRREAPGHA